MRVREETFPNARAKAARLSALAWEDTRNPVIRPVLDHVVRQLRSWAVRLPPGVYPSSGAAIAWTIHNFVRDCIRYVRDPIDPRTGRREEQFADPGVVLRRGYDDCDGKARLVVALALVAGLGARIRAVFRVGDFVHVQAELRWPGSDRYPNAQPGGWVVSETILLGVPLGNGAEAGLRDAYGGLVYS